MEQGENAEHDGDDAGPGTMVGEGPANANASDAENQQSASQKKHQKRTDRMHGSVVKGKECAGGGANCGEGQGGDEEQTADDHPKNAQCAEMFLKAIGDGFGGASKGLSTFRTEVVFRLQLGSTLIAEHAETSRTE
jgi:hypothetical protein